MIIWSDMRFYLILNISIRSIRYMIHVRSLTLKLHIAPIFDRLCNPDQSIVFIISPPVDCPSSSVKHTELKDRTDSWTHLISSMRQLLLAMSMPVLLLCSPSCPSPSPKASPEVESDGSKLFDCMFAAALLIMLSTSFLLGRLSAASSPATSSPNRKTIPETTVQDARTQHQSFGINPSDDLPDPVSAKGVKSLKALAIQKENYVYLAPTSERWHCSPNCQYIRKGRVKALPLCSACQVRNPPPETPVS